MAHEHSRSARPPGRMGFQYMPTDDLAGLPGALSPAGPVASIGTEGDQTVVALAGELDLATAPAILDTLGNVLAAGRHHVRVNLDAVTFMDVSALDVLVAARKRAVDSGGSLQLTAHPLCARLLELTGLVGLFSIYAG